MTSPDSPSLSRGTPEKACDCEGLWNDPATSMGPVARESYNRTRHLPNCPSSKFNEWYARPALSEGEPTPATRKWPWRCSPELRKLFWSDVQEAVAHAYRKHGDDQWARHEFKAILEEEFDEIWDAIKGDLPQDELRDEIIQLACVCLRYLETGDRHRETYAPESPDVR